MCVWRRCKILIIVSMMSLIDSFLHGNLSDWNQITSSYLYNKAYITFLVKWGQSQRKMNDPELMIDSIHILDELCCLLRIFFLIVLFIIFLVVLYWINTAIQNTVNKGVRIKSWMNVKTRKWHSVLNFCVTCYSFNSHHTVHGSIKT